MPEFNVLRADERIVLSLRALYESYGYRKYNMSEFEEYRLYMENKNFLVNESVIAFTDLDGRLMALKPDVTLSIVRHAADNVEQRVYYNENVYRPGKAKRNFREIAQMGLERIGRIDDYAVGETVCLAAKSLYTVSKDSLIEISHMGFAAGLIKSLGCDAAVSSELFALIGAKNIHGIRNLMKTAGLGGDAVEALCELPTLCGDAVKVIERAGKLCLNDDMSSALSQLECVVKILEAVKDICKVRLDLSLLGEEDYYNGVVFAGFVSGLPTRVLSGGQYDRMLRKFGHSGGAIGFALYLNELELMFEPHREQYDVAVIYDADSDMAQLSEYIDRLSGIGSVYTCPAGINCPVDTKKTVYFGKDGVKEADIC